MPENGLKMPRSASPVARSGAGDISERELSRERYNLQTTPPARLQPVHPKKKLFLTPVSKFTAKRCSPNPHLARIRNCLDDLQTPPKPVKLTPKAASMEDLTPNKRMRLENPQSEKQMPPIRSPGPHCDADEAAARVAKFMVVAAWRKRREEVRCVRKTLEAQVSCSERLRIQISALRSLLDSDNAKVRLAMRELDRLKQLLRDKDKEKAVLENEKLALENDVCAAEDRASEMSIGWRNCRNELECVRASAAAAECSARHNARELTAERDALYRKLVETEEEAVNLEEMRQLAEEDAVEARAQVVELQLEAERLRDEIEAQRLHELSIEAECALLREKLSSNEEEARRQQQELESVRALLRDTEEKLRDAREQLRWLPNKITSLVYWMRGLRPALVWGASPPCSHLPPPWLL